MSFHLIEPSPHHHTLREQLIECERRIILNTLIEVENHRRRAMKRLGLSRASLYRKLKTHGLTDGHRPS